MAADYYTMDEKRLIHPDGWHFFVRDGDDGVVEIGYREQRAGKWVDAGDLFTVPLAFTKPLAEALRYFADRPSAALGNYRLRDVPSGPSHPYEDQSGNGKHVEIRKEY